MNLITNNHPRDLIDGLDLTRDERDEFSYIKPDEWFEECFQRFFRYKGNVYDTQDCERTSNPTSELKDWDGFFSDTFFSGVVFRYVPDSDFEQVIVGRYYS